MSAACFRESGACGCMFCTILFIFYVALDFFGLLKKIYAFLHQSLMTLVAPQEGHLLCRSSARAFSKSLLLETGLPGNNCGENGH